MAERLNSTNQRWLLDQKLAVWKLKHLYDLIFDVGMNKGEDTAYYLGRASRVVGIDADPSMIKVVSAAFAKEVEEGRLTLLNVAVSEKDNENVKFYLADDPHHNSLSESLTKFGGSHGRGVITVKTRTLPSLVNEYGLPDYCKIDVQGYDVVLLKTLSQLEHPPQLISIETECGDKSGGEESLVPLEQLRKLRYQKFKLVDQATLRVLRPDSEFYGITLSKGFNRVLDHGLREVHEMLRPNTGFYGTSTSGPLCRSRELHFLTSHREMLSQKLGFNFQFGCSGPFGNDLDSEWLTYETAKKTLVYHRTSYLEAVSSGWKFPSIGFWCDWHAKFA